MPCGTYDVSIEPNFKNLQSKRVFGKPPKKFQFNISQIIAKFNFTVTIIVIIILTYVVEDDVGNNRWLVQMLCYPPK